MLLFLFNSLSRSKYYLYLSTTANNKQTEALLAYEKQVKTLNSVN